MEDDLDILSENMALIDFSKLFKCSFAHIARYIAYHFIQITLFRQMNNSVKAGSIALFA